MNRQVPLSTVEDCPDPSVHGSPFRYCPYCEWREPSEPPVSAEDIGQAIDPIPFMRSELENPDSAQWKIRRSRAIDAGERVLRTFTVGRISPDIRPEEDMK